jgi:hypothetical protein
MLETRGVKDSSMANAPWLKRALLVMFLGFGWLAQACGPNPNRAPCLRNCAEQKDVCMLEATSAQAIQSCDVHERSCSSICPN